MKTKFTGKRIQQILEAADWVDTLRSANIKKKIEAMLAEHGGRRQLWLYLARLGEVAQVLRSVQVDVEVTQSPDL